MFTVKIVKSIMTTSTNMAMNLPATFKDAIPFGNQHWRYTIPGHGITRWVDVFDYA